jgi:hypothetical protein
MVDVLAASIQKYRAAFQLVLGQAQFLDAAMSEHLGPPTGELGTVAGFFPP